MATHAPLEAPRRCWAPVIPLRWHFISARDSPAGLSTVHDDGETHLATLHRLAQVAPQLTHTCIPVSHDPCANVALQARCGHLLLEPKKLQGAATWPGVDRTRSGSEGTSAGRTNDARRGAGPGHRRLGGGALTVLACGTPAWLMARGDCCAATKASNALNPASALPVGFMRCTLRLVTPKTWLSLHVLNGDTVQNGVE